MEGPKFYIPLTGGNMGFMELPLAHLPDTENDMNDLLEVLRAEAAPLELWLALAKVYLSQVRISGLEFSLTLSLHLSQTVKAKNRRPVLCSTR